MIKIYLLFISFFFLGASTSAQNNTFPSSGNVGIGTNSPAYTLDVNGVVASKGIYNVGNSYSYNIANSLTEKTYEYKIFGPIGQFNTYQARWAYNSYTPYHYGVAIEWDVTINPGGDFLKAFGIDHVGNGMFAGGLNVGGNVGVGTSTPDAKLAVNGTIHAKEVRVDLNVPGADYVFEKSYSLRSLATVNKYISVNHHLPDVPSAESMEKNGIDISRMNMKLLQKIEELTLYLIQLKKENAQQNERLRKLESPK